MDGTDRSAVENIPMKESSRVDLRTRDNSQYRDAGESKER